MRIFLRILSVMFIGTSCSLSVVACNKCTTTTDNGGSKPPDNKPVTYNVSFKEISTVDGLNFSFKNGGFYRDFQFLKKDVIGSSGLPNDFWRYVDGKKTLLGTDFAVYDDNLWDKVAFVYGFNRNSTDTEIATLMKNNSIVNVVASVEKDAGKWKLLSFLLELKGN